MPTQIFTFVALPNGITPKGDLQLSIYFAPRLSDGATLAVFPDMLHWTRSIADKGLQFQLQCNGQSATVAVDQTALRPGIWNSIFRPDTIVQPFVIPALDQQLLVSYPHREALAYVKHLYQTSGLGVAFPRSHGDNGRSLTLAQLEDLLFRDGQKSTLDIANSETRIELWREQNAQTSGSPVLAPRTTAAGTAKTPSGPSPLEAPLDGVPTTLTAPSGGRAMARRFALYHHLPPAPNRPPLPSTPADFANLLDFHKAMTALSSYPQLMRALGLVFDLEIPSSFCPVSPAATGGDYLAIAVTGVTPGFVWASAPQFCLPLTSYYRTTTDFLTAPATPSSNLPTQDYVPGDIVGGVLALLTRYFHLTEVDVDGGLLKAMSFADNLDSFALSRETAEIDETLPSLRSAGLGLVANHRAAQFLQTIQTNKTFDAALQQNKPLPRPFNAMDVTRGFRIDIWSSLDQRWRSLHRRNGTYHFLHPKPISLHTHDEEGFIQLAVAQPAQEPTPPTNAAATRAGAPQPNTDVRIHERVVKWEGWSLSVPRPGAVLNRSPDPAKALDSDPTMNQPMTPFKMKTSFEAVKGSLPRLRFGARYRLRARAVDLAGNSIPYNEPASGEIAAPMHGQLPYFRFEPVPHPIVVLRHPVSYGGSMERLVIRSYNTRPELDRVDTEETDQRHIAPPKAAVRMAEQHGMFDTPQGLLKGDAATYRLIIRRDRGQIPSVDKTPMESEAQLAVDYFPDPIARGAALQNLPNTPNNSFGKAVGGEIKYKLPPNLHPEYAAQELATGSFTHIDFGPHWPARETFRLVLSEGSVAPTWNAPERVLRVRLPKAGIAQVSMGSYLNAADLSLMGVWDWIRQYMELQQMAAMAEAGANLEVPYSADQMAVLSQLVLNGGHSMITPSRTLVFVHAVQQPLGTPAFILLPIVRSMPASEQGTGLANGFDPISAWRTLNSHYAVLLGGLRIHGMSTAQVDINATWHEYLDLTTEPAPSVLPTQAHVDTITLSSDPDDLSEPTEGIIAADALATRYTAYYFPEVDTLWFAAPFDSLQGFGSISNLAAPMHRFSDTKHRRIYYQAVSTSRFREYFPPDTKNFTRSSERLLVNVPSSSRPVAPHVAYIVPTFGIERQETTNIKTDVRIGNGVRVYLNRPWYSSGEGELLGVVLWAASAPSPTSADRETYKHYITQWGLDPMWETGSLAELPQMSFPVAQGQGLTLAETSAITVDVAGYEAGFDASRKLWYCDITFSNPSAYQPFVHLAMARYQPSSLPSVELSHVVLADFVQIAPDRSAVVSIDPADPRRARVFIGGNSPQGPNRSIFYVTVEQKMANIVSDLAWNPAPSNVVTVTEDSPAPVQPDAVLWSGTVLFAAAPPAGQFRVVIKECEQIPRDPSPQEVKSTVLGQRVVYASIIPFDFPSPAQL
jgi:hypothetical protein